LTAILALTTATPAWAWGRLVYRLAERHLSARAKAAVARLLEPDESLAETSIWADDHRQTR
jgi:hypothetical protein